MKKIRQVQPEDLIGPLHSSSIVRRHPLNPIFKSENVPYRSLIAYNAGVMLQDLENPRKVIAYSKEPLIAPKAPL